MSVTVDSRTATAKTAVRSAYSAFYVDMLDIYLPVLILAPAIGYFVSPKLSTAWAAVVSATIFVGTLLGRPVGAGVFGHVADKLGRRRVAIFTMGASGTTTLVMAALPGYENWGAFSVVLFVFLRILNGVFLGGQYTAANPLAMEAAPKNKRGIYGSLITSAFPTAYATVTLAAMVLLAALPSSGLDSAYVQWGWRIPFAVIGLFEIFLTVYYYLKVDESEVWHEKKTEHKTSAAKELVSGKARKPLIQVFVLMTGLWLALQSVAAILPGLLSDSVNLTSFNANVTLVIAYLVLIPVHLTTGIASQKYGRRPSLMALGLLIATVGTLLYYFLIREGEGLAFPLLIALVAVIVCIVDGPFALTISYINERFQVGERASGYGLSYSLSVVIPSFYAYYQILLSKIMPFEYTVLVLLVIGGGLTLVGAAMGPETKDVDFADEKR